MLQGGIGISSLPPCCFPSPIQWHQGKGEVKCHLALPHWWPVWVKSSHWYQGKVELYIKLPVQSCSCQMGVEVQPHNKPCWHNGEGKVMCLLSLICITLFSFFDRVGKKSQFHTSSTDCVCVCVCVCMYVCVAGGGEVKLHRDCLVMSHHYWVGVEDHRAIWFWQVRDRISAAHWVLQKPPVRGIETSLAASRQEDWLEAQLSNWLTETSGEVMQFRHYCWLKSGDCCQKVFMLFEWGVSREKQVFLGIFFAYAFLVVLHYRLSQNPVWDTWAPLRKSIAIRNSARKVSGLTRRSIFSSLPVRVSLCLLCCLRCKN